MSVVAAFLLAVGPATRAETSCGQTATNPTSAPACILKPSQPVRPRGSPVSWIPLSDYPGWESRIAVEGMVKARLSVGRNGRPFACTITETSGDGKLDEHTCRLLLRRARFCPATDRKSKPIDGEWSGAIRWKIPD
ncbi:MAG: energy transducer TonB [Novosphingobium sp.]